MDSPLTQNHLVPPDILQRYSTTAPRYTSYPTAPVWQDHPSLRDVEQWLAQARDSREPLSVYVHIPFCHKLCWYCGCNMTVTRNQDLVARYLGAVVDEMKRVAELMGPLPVVQVHWGGGTPTFLNPTQIEQLHNALTRHFTLMPGAEMAFEVHPPVTTLEQVRVLAQLGFNRMSMGVQDFDPRVQQAVHRIQPLEQTRALVDACRHHGFMSVNLDLMYGLPHQTPESFAQTLDAMELIHPDRIALFGYAHMPSIKRHQRLLPQDALPDPSQRLTIFQSAMQRLHSLGYRYIGLDHFALPDNELCVAMDHGTLRRNFMGYTTCAQSNLMAFGASSISDLDVAYMQNAREVPDYLVRMRDTGLPVTRGMALSEDDRLRRDVISRLFCNLAIDKNAVEQRFHIRFDDHFSHELTQMTTLERDGLVTVEMDRIRVTPRGQVLLRNIAAVFDAYLRKPDGRQTRFSQTV